MPTPAAGPWDGAPTVPGITYTRLFFATPANGMYNHAAMIDAHNGKLLAWWKNAPRDEDSAGQRVLFAASADGRSRTTPPPSRPPCPRAPG